MDQANAIDQEVLNKHQPANEQDGLMRALFYAHSLAMLSKRQIETFLNRCESGEFGPTIQSSVPAVSEEAIAAATKVLSCMSLHMLGLDWCTEGSPAWLIQFVFESLKEVDEQIPEPEAADIIATHGSWTRQKMAYDSAQQACQLLGLSLSDDRPVEIFYNFFLTSAPYREEMLLFALSQPAEALQHHMDVFS